jgi:hypothetical protein
VVYESVYRGGGVPGGEELFTSWTRKLETLAAQGPTISFEDTSVNI